MKSNGMVTRKGLGRSVYITLFFVIETLSFYVGGIFSFSDLSLNNVGEHFETVLTQFYLPWKWINHKTGICMLFGVVVFCILSSYLMSTYRNFQTNIEYGSADWGDPFEITKRRAEKDPKLNRQLSENTFISIDKNRGPSNNNMLLIGSSGQGKTTALLMKNLLNLLANGIYLDVKGEILFLYGHFLEKNGYDVASLNLIDKTRTLRYNPFVYIENEEDLIALIDNLYYCFSEENKSSNDAPIWDEGPHLYLQALFYYEWEQQKRTGRYGLLTNIARYANEEMEIVSLDSNNRPITKLQRRMEELPSDHPGCISYFKMKSGAEETVQSFIVIINARLKLFEMKSVQYVFSDDELNLRDFGTGVGGTVQKPTDKKKALFICVPDDDSSYNFIASMLYTQLFRILKRMADFDFADRGRTLPIPLEVWMDEFYAGARPKDTEKLMGVTRSRNISLIPILQSKAQLDICFPGKKSEVLLDNCATTVFLGAGRTANETHEWVSKLLGNMTIDTFHDGRSGNNLSGNYGKKDRALMTPDEVAQMDREYCIIFLEEEKPIYDKKAFPWLDQTKESPYKIAMQLNKDDPNGGFLFPIRAVVDAEGNYYANIEGRPPIREISASEIPEDVEVLDLDDEELICNLYIPFSPKQPDYTELKKFMSSFVQLEDEKDMEISEQEQLRNQVIAQIQSDQTLSKEEMLNEIRPFLTNSQVERLTEVLNQVTRDDLITLFAMSEADMGNFIMLKQRIKIASKK